MFRCRTLRGPERRADAATRIARCRSLQVSPTTCRCCRPGGPTRDPMSGLTSERMRRLIAGSARALRLGDHRHAAGRRCCPTPTCWRRWSTGAAGRAGRQDAATTLVKRGGRRDRPRAHPRRRAQPRRARAGRPRATATTATTTARDRGRSTKAHDRSARFSASDVALDRRSIGCRDRADRLRRWSLAAYVRLGDGGVGVVSSENGAARKALLIAGVVPALPVLRRSLRLRGSSPTGASCSSASCRRSASTSLILAALYFWFPALIIGRGVFMLAALLVDRCS